MICPDIFTYLASRPGPREIYIIGSGPAGLAAFPRIPESTHTIALNSAIRYDFPFTWWLAFDLGMMKYPWWPDLYPPRSTKLVFGSGLCDAMYGRPEYEDGRIVPSYRFQYRPSLHTQYVLAQIAAKRLDNPLVANRLRGGVSVAGCALQFCAFAGAKRIVLCGVELRGNKHFDGFVNPQMTVGNWGILRKAQWLCDALRKNHGIEIVSMNTTALQVPIISL